MFEKVGILLIGSILTVIVYSINKKFDNWRAKKNILRSFKYELEYNISLLGKYIDNIDNYLLIINRPNEELFLLDYKFEDYQTHFFKLTLEKGYLYEELEIKKISRMNTIHNRLNPKEEDKLNNLFKEAIQLKTDSEEIIKYYKLMKESFIFHREFLEIIKNLIS